MLNPTEKRTISCRPPNNSLSAVTFLHQLVHISTWSFAGNNLKHLVECAHESLCVCIQCSKALSACLFSVMLSSWAAYYRKFDPNIKCFLLKYLKHGYLYDLGSLCSEICICFQKPDIKIWKKIVRIKILPLNCCFITHSVQMQSICENLATLLELFWCCIRQSLIQLFHFVWITLSGIQYFIY